MAKRDLTKEHLQVTDEMNLTWTVPRGSQLHSLLIPMIEAGYLRPSLPRAVILTPQEPELWRIANVKHAEQLNAKLKRLIELARSGSNVEYLIRSILEAETQRTVTRMLLQT